jgi:hypothetical protein
MRKPCKVMQSINYIICFLGLLTSLHDQKKYGGLYEGTFMEQKCILLLKISNSAVVGTLYTGRNTSHNVMGTFENGQLNATLHHKTLGNAELIGSFDKDKLMADIFVLNRAFPLRLEQKSKSTEVDFDKYFGRSSLDFNLIGSWKVISDISYKNTIVNSHTKKHFFKDGSMQMDGMKMDSKGTSLPPAFTWYTSDQHLYVRMYMNGKSVLEMENGEYKISNDTLTILGVGKFAGGKTVYVKEH